MANSPDHPELRFVQAAGYTRGRPDGPPKWIVIHDMEANENSATAENTAAYFANPGDGRAVSSHYCVDDNSIVQCVKLADTAWTVGNRPGNNLGINWELAGFARQTRAQWLDAFGLAMFSRMAPYVVADAKRFGIPLERRTVAELKAFRPGITSHNDLRLAFGTTSHTDPGPNFPWDVFLATLEDDDMDQATFDRLLRGALTGDSADARAVQALYKALPMQYPVTPTQSLLTLHKQTSTDAATAATRTPDPTAFAQALVAEPAFTAALEKAAEKAVRKVAADAADPTD